MITHTLPLSEALKAFEIASDKGHDAFLVEWTMEEFELPIERALKSSFSLAHFHLSALDHPGAALHGIKERVLDPWQRALREKREITLAEIAMATGITRNTLSKMVNHPTESVRTENIDRLCAYFDCKVQEILKRE